ncbi:MAG: hypothetical protein ABIO63_02200 [Casimicrobiaceae bacterium]
MPNQFACEIVFSLSSLPHKDRYTFFGGRLVSSIIDLIEKGADLERDIFMPVVMESKQVEKELKDGIYKVYISGTVDETAPHPEHPEDESEWIFQEDVMVFIPLSVKTEEAILRKLKQP